jgi:hypothetical protein
MIFWYVFWYVKIKKRPKGAFLLHHWDRGIPIMANESVFKVFLGFKLYILPVFLPSMLTLT